MIIGAHSIIYSTSPEADRAFLGDVLRFPSVDVGGGWLIFGLPPAEVAVRVKKAAKKPAGRAAKKATQTTSRKTPPKKARRR